MNADETELYQMKSGALIKNQTYANDVMPPDDLVRTVMKFNGAQELPLGGLACDCPKGPENPECCINKLGLK